MGKRFYKPPIMVDYRKLFSVVNHVFVCATTQKPPERKKPMKKIIAYKRYYADFMAKLSQPERIKIMRALLLFETEDKIPHHYIKYIRDGIYEFRVNYGNNEFRIFFIYYGDTIVVLFNCFKKSTRSS